MLEFVNDLSRKKILLHRREVVSSIPLPFLRCREISSLSGYRACGKKCKVPAASPILPGTPKIS